LIGAFQDGDLDWKNRSLCQFINDEPEVDGMRAYIEFVFRGQYITLLADLAMSHGGIDVFQDRTRTVCFEDLMTDAVGKGEAILHFLYNGRGSIDRASLEGQLYNYTGGHSTSKDASVRQRLRDVIQSADAMYYDGDIAWLDRSGVMKCDL